MKLSIYSDGGARGNPGPAGIGAVIYNADNKVLAEISEYIGISTNNQAEYKALIKGLEKALGLGATEVSCFLDSELIVKQISREYKVKNRELAFLFLQVYNLLTRFKNYSCQHIVREKNKEADRLANEAMDRGK